MKNNNSSWYEKLKVLIPMRRYLNNSGIHESFLILKKYYPNLKLLKFHKNEKCGLWKVPLSWNVKIGKLIDPRGRKIADYFRNPLELYSNSISFSGKFNKKKMDKSLLKLNKMLTNDTL